MLSASDGSKKWRAKRSTLPFEVSRLYQYFWGILFCAVGLCESAEDDLHIFVFYDQH